MPKGILIERKLLDEIAEHLQGSGFIGSANRLRMAMEIAPQAVISIEKAHDCGQCPICWAYGNALCCMNSMTENKSIVVAKAWKENIASPDWCPQITKE